MRTSKAKSGEMGRASYKMLALAVAIAACLPTYVAAAEPTSSRQAVVNFDIPSGDLSEALERFSVQSGIQVMYRPGLISGKKTQAVVGSFTPESALERMLDGTNLEIERANHSTYVLKERPASQNGRERNSAEIPASSRSGGTADDGRIIVVPEVLVVANKSLNLDAVRSEDEVLPYVVFSREEIENSLSLSIEEFLSTRLPMNQTRGTASRNTPEGERGNRSAFNLRGLGENQTLILVNGRRAPGVSMLQRGDMDQPDLNGIPVSAVERIEVLPATASAIYGGGATGGVINVVLRSDYSGSQVSLLYDNSFDTDSARRVYNFITGFPLEGGKTQVTLSANLSDSNHLLVRDRGFAQDGRRLAIESYPLSWSSDIKGARTNYASIDGSELVLKGGARLGSAFGTVPYGYAGPSSDGGLGLSAGAGTFNVDVPNNIVGGSQSLYAGPTTYSVYTTMRREFSERTFGYLDVGRSANKSTTRWAGFGSDTYLSPGDPGNPFQNGVRVIFTNGGAEMLSTSDSVTDKVNAGFAFQLSSDWALGVDLNHSRSTNKYSRPSRYDDLAIYSAISQGKLDVFRDSPLSEAELSPYAKKTESVYGPAHASVSDVSVRAAGPIAQLPNGPLAVTTVFSWRREGADDLYVGDGPYRYYPERHSDVKSAYIEGAAPLIAASQEIPFVNRLDAHFSLRRDDYTTVSVPSGQWLQVQDLSSNLPDFLYSKAQASSTNYALGLLYKPSPSVSIRASHSTGFLPPSIAQVAQADPLVTPLFVFDPKRGGELEMIGPIPVRLFGGSVDLKPELSKSTSMGLVFSPDAFDWLRVSVDYTRIRKTDEIVHIGYQELIDREDELPGRISRGGKMPGDPADWSGVITEIDASLMNIASSKVEAFDFQVDAEKGFGRFGVLHLYAVAGIQTDLSRKVLPIDEFVNRVGYSDGVTKLRGNVGLNWQHRSVVVAVNTQFYDAYKVYRSSDSPVAVESTVLFQGSETIPSQHYTDVSFRYSFDEGVLRGMALKLGVRNVFDKRPPTIATWDTRGGYSTYGDPRLRSYMLSLEYAF